MNFILKALYQFDFNLNWYRNFIIVICLGVVFIIVCHYTLRFVSF